MINLKVPNKVDYTMLSTFLTCRRKYYYRIMRGLVGKKPPTAAEFGRCIHLSLDEWFKSHDIEKAKQVFRNNFTPDETDEKRTVPVAMKLLDLYGEKYDYEGFKVLETEKVFDIPIDGADISLIGRIDKIIDWEGAIYVMDHKAQPLDSLVLTPTGWVTMGALKIGDKVVDTKGTATTVTGIFPQGDLECYEIEFTDGAKVKCSYDHLWAVTTQYNKKKVLKLSDILKLKSYKFKVPIVQPIQYASTSELLVSPYLLGVLLGDGCLSGHVIEVSIGDKDKEELLTHIKKELPKDIIIQKCSGDNYSYILKSTVKANSLIRELKKLGLMGILSQTKFIPKEYLTSKYRLELLRGLLDTDGCVYNGHIMFDNTRLDIVKGVVELVRSLGGVARFRKRSGTIQQAYRVSIRLDNVIPFKLTRKIKKLRPLLRKPTRYIKNIKKVGLEIMQCISVEGDLYVTNDFIVTHNTTSRLGAEFFYKIKPNMQFDGYIYAARRIGFPSCNGVVMDALLVAKGLCVPAQLAKLTPLARDISTRTDVELVEYENNLLQLLSDLKASYAEPEPKFYMNTESCCDFVQCPYRSICKEEPVMKERIIEQDYVVDVWDPAKRVEGGDA